MIIRIHTYVYIYMYMYTLTCLGAAFCAPPRFHMTQVYMVNIMYERNTNSSSSMRTTIYLQYLSMPPGNGKVLTPIMKCSTGCKPTDKADWATPTGNACFINPHHLQGLPLHRMIRPNVLAILHQLPKWQYPTI